MPHNITLSQSSRVLPLETTTFLWLLRFALVCFGFIWAIDYYTGILVPFDAIAYPICMLSLFLLCIATKRQWLQEEYIHLSGYCVVAGFLTSSSIWHHMTSAGPAFNAAQWLGLNYVMAYLFLDIRKAVMTTIIVLLLTLIGHYMAIAEYRTLDDSLGIVANMGVAHAVFVVLLWTVIKMRISAAELNERMRLLEQHSAIDPLTRISNRRGLESMLQQLEKQPPPLFAMLLIDIDYFKSINDLYGHVKGDTVLAGIAETLKTAIDSTDQLGRWGGEEFLLVTRCENHQQAYRLADKLRRLVEAQPYLSYRKVTISVGISYSDQADSMQALFEMADKNLYIAKKQGRNRVINSGHTADTEPMI